MYLRVGLPVALPARRCHQPLIDSSDKQGGRLQILPAHVTLNMCVCMRGSLRTLPMYVTLTLSASYQSEREREREREAVSGMKDCRKPEREVERGRGERGSETDCQARAKSLSNISLLGVCVCVCVCFNNTNTQKWTLTGQNISGNFS